MARKARSAVEDLRGASRLAIDATRGVTALVEALHRTIASGPAVLGMPLEGPARLLTAPVYGTIRGVTKLVGAGIDLALGQLAPVLGGGAPGAEREALLAALNGVLGDYLQETRNPLAIEMRLRRGGEPVALDLDSPAARRRALREAFPAAPGRVLVLVHGSAMSDLQWNRGGHDHGAALARDLGLAPLYLHYNSGLHVSTNGRELARLLERLHASWPRPLRELVLLGHSMGGLVARSACHAAEAEALGWRRKLRALVCLGTPHHGAPLERAGNWLEAALDLSRYSQPFTRLGRVRSAGVTDLRYGYVLDEHWQGRDRFALSGDRRVPLPLPAGVACYAIAGTTARGPQPGRLPGDGLVPVDSALGIHRRPEQSLDFPEGHRSVAWNTGHVDLLARKEVCSTMRRWLSG